MFVAGSHMWLIPNRLCVLAYLLACLLACESVYMRARNAFQGDDERREAQGEKKTENTGKRGGLSVEGKRNSRGG